MRNWVFTSHCTIQTSTSDWNFVAVEVLNRFPLESPSCLFLLITRRFNFLYVLRFLGRMYTEGWNWKECCWDQWNIPSTFLTLTLLLLLLVASPGYLVAFTRNFMYWNCALIFSFYLFVVYLTTLSVTEWDNDHLVASTCYKAALN